MKCPKCGSEYEGISCPKCNGPKIIINDNDYLRRKKEWEEQGKVLGAKVKKDSNDIDNQQDDEEKEFKMPVLPKVNIDIKKVKDVVNTKIYNNINRSINTKSNKEFIKKYWLKTSLIIITLVIAVMAGTGVYRLYKRFNMTMYIVGTDGRICTGGSLENKLIGNVDDVIFSLDGDAFYENKLPSEVSKKTVIYSYASQNGNYFVTQVFDDISTYTLYVWNNDGVKKVIEGMNQKEVKYISDNGKVLFNDVTYLYEQTVSNISLYEYDATASIDKSNEKGVLTLIEKNVRSQYLYLKNNTLVYLNSSNKLFTINFSKLADKTLIAENIKDIYGVSNQTNNLYSNSTEIAKPSDKNETFIYSQSGKFYYYDISNKTATYLFNSTLSGVEIVYEKDPGDVYCISMSSISFGTVKKDIGTELSSLDSIVSAEDMCYYPESSTFVYVNKDGQLISVNKGNKTLVRSGVSSESLNRVRNSDGITYIADGVQYYRTSLNAAEVMLQNIAAGNDTSQTLVYKNNIYFMSADGELCSCSMKGKDFNTFGAVKSYWVK